MKDWNSQVEWIIPGPSHTHMKSCFIVLLIQLVFQSTCQTLNLVLGCSTMSLKLGSSALVYSRDTLVSSYAGQNT